MRQISAALLLAGVLSVPIDVEAQNQGSPLSALLPELYEEVITTQIIVFMVALPQFGVYPDIDGLFASASERFRNDSYPIIGLAGNQLSSFPLASASGGFSWTLDTASGVFTRASNSFGPIFAERPLTIGRGRLNVGANFQHVSFDHLQDRNLRGGEIVSYFSTPIFETEHIFFANALDLKVTTDTLNVFATYGVTDRLDLGVAVPINRVDVRATVTSQIGLTSTGILDELSPLVTSTSGTDSGIGDVVVRAKYHMSGGDAWNVAQSVDVRLPTGDELNLLGIAGPQLKLTFIASSAIGELSPHANLAYTISGASGAADDLAYVAAPPEEINYAAGADLAVSLRTTVAADIVGRVMRKIGKLEWSPSGFGGSQYQQFYFDAGQDLHLLLGSVGLKVNPFGNMLLTTNVLFPLKKNGLTDQLTWMAGVDYSF